MDSLNFPPPCCDVRAGEIAAEFLMGRAVDSCIDGQLRLILKALPIEPG